MTYSKKYFNLLQVSMFVPFGKWDMYHPLWNLMTTMHWTRNHVSLEHPRIVSFEHHPLLCSMPGVHHRAFQVRNLFPFVAWNLELGEKTKYELWKLKRKCMFCMEFVAHSHNNAGLYWLNTIWWTGPLSMKFQNVRAGKIPIQYGSQSQQLVDEFKIVKRKMMKI